MEETAAAIDDLPCPLRGTRDNQRLLQGNCALNMAVELFSGKDFVNRFWSGTRAQLTC
jgi:hypothetical protein